MRRGKQESKDLRKLNYDRVVAYIFGLIWPSLETGLLYGASAVEKFRAFCLGVRITDQVLHPGRKGAAWQEETRRLAQDQPKVARWVTEEARITLDKEFARRTVVVAKNSDAQGAQLTFAILLEVPLLCPDLIFCGGAQKFLTDAYNLGKLDDKGEKSLENAVKNRCREIRDQEEKDQLQREKLLIELAVELKTNGGGLAAGRALRKELEESPQAGLGKLLQEALEGYIAVADTAAKVLSFQDPCSVAMPGAEAPHRAVKEFQCGGGVAGRYTHMNQQPFGNPAKSCERLKA